MSDSFLDTPVTFECDGNLLHGILSKPETSFDAAVIIVVGGPQFRVGSHRQFVLLARYLAGQGVLVLRFDYTGMGYSEGQPKKFYEIDHDIHTAIDFVTRRFPQVKNTHLWGLCDAASAIAFTAYTDSRIDGIIISNPWVRSDASHSEVILKTYYRDRIFSWDVWRELLVSPSKIFNAVVSLSGVCTKVLTNIFHPKSSKKKSVNEISLTERQNNLAASVLSGMNRFNGKICLLLSEKDLTADEFKREFENSDWMQQVENMQKITIHHLDEADHTFSTALWRAQVEKLTMNFLRA